MSRKQLRPEDFSTYLKAFEEGKFHHFLYGGQAINVWANVFSPIRPALCRYAPFTSKDCDVWISYELFLRIHEIVPGRLLKSASPSDGQLGILYTTDAPPNIIDLLGGVFGLSHAEVERAWKRSFVLNGIRVIDPIFLFKGKCHNLVHLPQAGRNDEGHLVLLFEILSAHFEIMVKRCATGMITERQMLEEMKLLRSFKKDQWVRRALSRLGRALDEALPLELLKSCGLPKIERYAAGTQET